MAVRDTPTIAGLTGGADAFGLIEGVQIHDMDFRPLAGGPANAPPPAAVAAIYRFDSGADAFGAGVPESLRADYTGYDLVLFINLADTTLDNPQIGLTTTGAGGTHLMQLESYGIDSSAPWTRVTIDGLGSGQVWAILVPDLGPGGLAVNASVDGGPDIAASVMNAPLDKGRVVFIEAMPMASSVESPIQRLDAFAVSPDGDFLYGVSGDEATLLVINADDLSMRQAISEGFSVTPGGDVVFGLAGADSLVVSPDGKFVFAFAEGSDTAAAFSVGTIVSYAGTATFDVPGGVSALEIFSTSTPGVYSYFVLGGDGMTMQTGSYTAATGTFDLHGSTVSNTATAVAVVTVSNDGSRYYTSDAAGDVFEVRSFDAGSPLQTFAGAEYGFDGISAIEISDDDRFIYVLGKLSNSITVFEHTGDGTVVFVQTLRDGYDGVEGMTNPGIVSLARPDSAGDQNFVFVTGRDSRTVAVFVRDPSTGGLEFAQLLADNAKGVGGLRGPTDMSLSGDHLYVSVAGQAGFPGGVVALRLENDIASVSVRHLDLSFDNVWSLTVTTAGGDDGLRIAGGGNSSALDILSFVGVNLEGGNDSVNITKLVGETVVRMGGGEDVVTIAAPSSTDVALEVHGGPDEDLIQLLETGSRSSITLYGDGGDDTFTVDSVGLALDMANLMIHGREPFPTRETDRLVFLNWADYGQPGPPPDVDDGLNAILFADDAHATGDAYENDPGRRSVGGVLGVADPDAGQRRVVAASVAGVYGLFTVDAHGVWRYEIDENDPDTNQLDDGEQVLETFVVTSVDGTASTVVSVRVHGASDTATDVPVTPVDGAEPAVIGGDREGAVTEDAPAHRMAMGTLTVTDPDVGEAGFQAQSEVEGIYGAFTLSAGGAWVYTLDNEDPDTGALVAGLTGTEIFEVFTTDGTRAEVVITVAGTDDEAPLAGADATIGGVRKGYVREDNPDRAEFTGTLTVTDAPGEAAFRAQTDVAGTYGTFTLDAGGTWTYVLDNADADTDALAAGQRRVEIFEVLTIDGTRAAVVAVVRGADDAAVIGGTTTGAVTEDDPNRTEATGTLTVADDAGEAGFQRKTAVGIYGTFTLSAGGAWVYVLANEDPDTDALAANETGTDTFEVLTTDGTRAQVVVTVTGTDDEAVVVGRFTGAVTEDAALVEATGTLTVVDPDSTLTQSQSGFQVRTDIVGTYGTFTLDAGGAWTYVLDDADALAANETGTETFEVFTDGGIRAEVVVTVIGANDAAVIGGDRTGAVTEDDSAHLEATGTLTVTDPDAGEVSFQAQDRTPGTYGHFTLQADGVWRYMLDAAASDGLTAGQKVVDVFVVTSADGTESEVVVTVTGADEPGAPSVANQAAAIGGDRVGTVTEDARAHLEVTGMLTVTDPDAGETSFQAQSRTPGTYGYFTLQADGGWRYVLNDAASDELTAGQKVLDVFTVASADGTESVVVVTVIGANDRARVFGGYAVSHASVDLLFDAGPILSLTQPLIIAEGEDLDVDIGVWALGWTGDLYGDVVWDFDGDGVFDDKIGAQFTVTWYELSYVYGMDDDGTYSIVARATNQGSDLGEGITNFKHFEVIITNTPPEIEVLGLPTVRPGSPYILEFSASDPGDDTVHEWQIDWDSGGTSMVEVLGAGTTSAQHAYDEPGTKVIRVTALDDDGTTMGPSFSISVVVENRDVDHGGPYTIAEGEDLVLTGSAPGTPSLHEWFVWRPEWGTESGSAVRVHSGSNQTDGATVSWQTLVDAGVTDDGRYSLLYRVTYANGSQANAVTQLTVTNAAPKAMLSLSETSIDEGGQVTATIGATDWASADNVGLTYYFDTDGDGIYDWTDSGSGEYTESVHTFTVADGQERITIRVKVTDKDGGSTEVTEDLVVNNVAPTLNIEAVSGNWSTTEGADFEVALSAVDPGDDAIERWEINWGDGSDVETFDEVSPTLAHRFRKSGPVTITVTAYDEDGGPYEATQTIDVTNAAPEMEVTVAPATEGAETRVKGRFSDEGIEESFSVTIAWGDGTDATKVSLDGDADTFDVGHVYVAEGTYIITIMLSDADGGTATETRQVVIVNAAPEVSFSVDQFTIDEGSAVTITGTVTDSGIDDTLSVSIAWGDGTPDSTAVVDQATGYFTVTHRYADDSASNAGSVFTIVVTALDDDGAVGKASRDVQVDNLDPVFEYFYVSNVAGVDYQRPLVNAVVSDAKIEIVIDPVDGSRVSVAGAYEDFGIEVGIIRIWWGDGNITRAEIDERTKTFTATYTYASDSNAAGFVDSIEVLASTLPVRIEKNSVVTVRGRVQDAGADVVTATVDWGDGTVDDAPVDPMTGEFVLTHRYSVDVGASPSSRDEAGRRAPETSTRSGSASVISIVGTAQDDDGGTVSVSHTVLVEAPPKFSREEYAFDLKENLDGSVTSVNVGVVMATDENADDVLSYSIGGGNASGYFVIDGGVLSYVGPGEDFESASVDYVLIVTAIDQTGRSDSATVKVTIVDVGELATIGGNRTGAVTEDEVQSEATGTLTVADPDAGEAGFVTKTEVGTYGTFTLGADGVWTYELDNQDPDTNALAIRQEATDSFDVVTIDGTVSQVTVTVTGADDATVIGGDTIGAVTEDDANAATASGTLKVLDPDADLAAQQRGFTAQTEVMHANGYGTFTLWEDGSWTYTLDNDAANALRAGEEVTKTFDVMSAGGIGSKVTITVTGADDAEVVGGDRSGTVTEDAVQIEATGTLTVVDPDTVVTGFQAQTKTGTYGTFTLGADGAWTYALDNARANELRAGREMTEIFDVMTTGGTRIEVVITVTGADDTAAVGGSAKGTVTEDDPQAQTATGTLTVADPDAGEAAFRVAGRSVGSYGVFTVDAGGKWTYKLDNFAANALGAGEEVTEKFSVFTIDGTLAEVVITVKGANDAAVIGGNATGAVTEDDAQAKTASGNLTVTDPDAGEAAFVTRTAVGVYGTFTLGADGMWTYALNNADADTNALGAGEEVTEKFSVFTADGTGGGGRRGGHWRGPRW